jgi:acetylglutamate kinase
VNPNLRDATGPAVGPERAPPRSAAEPAEPERRRSQVGLTLAEGLRYATQWRGKTVVVKLGGSILEQASAAAFEDIVLLQRAGVNVVLVHGGGSEISRVLSRMGHVPRFIDGLRVTDEETMEVVEMVLTGRVNKRLVAGIEQAGGRATGLSGKDGSLIVARPHPAAARLGLVGEVESIRTEVLDAVVAAGFVPVVSSIGGDRAGNSYNLNADAAAAALAGALRAEKLILLTDVEGVSRVACDRRELVSELDPAGARAMLDGGEVSGGMIPKLQACVAAIEGGARSAHIVGPRDPDGLLIELLTDRGIGTMVRNGAGAPARTGSPAAGGGPPRVSRTEAAITASEEHLFRNYAREPIAFSHGRGAVLWDLDGREYLDFIGGIAVSSLGHAHPALVRAIEEQAERYLHVSNLYHIPEQAEAASLLKQATGFSRAFFCNSGTEAVEAAIKLARKWARQRGLSPGEIVVAEGSFHGRTLGALAATGVARYREAFEPLIPGFRFVPFNDLEAVRAAVGPDTCAIMVEPIQGEGGVIPADPDYLRGLRAIATEIDALLLLDEVQTGIGRTGRWMAFEHYGIRPDVVTLAKGLGGGIAVGAVLASGPAEDVFAPGDHGTTFGGNALACAAASAVLRTIREDSLLENATSMGHKLAEGIEAMTLQQPVVRDVRGRGLLLGVDLAIDAAPVSSRCREHGLLLNAVRPRTLRLAPPLTVSASEVEAALIILREVLNEACKGDFHAS